MTTVPVSDRAFNYGDGVFETVRLRDGRSPLQAAHCARLKAGVTALQLPLRPAQVDDALSAAIADAPVGDQILKLVISRGSSARGYAPQPGAPVRIVTRYQAWQPRAADLYRHGLVTGICRQRLGGGLPAIKHLNRLPQVLAAADVQSHGWDEGLMLDDLGRPAEWTAMNLFARFGDTLWTPPSHQLAVPGVFRHWLLQDWLPGSGLRLSEKPCALSRLREADEVFAANSVAGAMPVRKLAQWSWAPGESVRSVQTAFDGIFS